MGPRDPLLENLRGDQRFQRMMAQVRAEVDEMRRRVEDGTGSVSRLYDLRAIGIGPPGTHSRLRLGARPLQANEAHATLVHVLHDQPGPSR